MAPSLPTAGGGASPRNKGQYRKGDTRPRGENTGRRALPREQLGQLRDIAMLFAGCLTEMLPSREQPDDNASDRQAKPSPAEYDRLLRKGDSLIDSLDTLTRIVILLLDKEQQRRASPQPSRRTISKADEDELDRKIQAELDRLVDDDEEAEGPDADS